MTTASEYPSALVEHVRALDESGGYRSSVNIDDIERLASVVGGSLLIYSGLRRRSISGLALGVLGGLLLRRGITGHCELYEALGVAPAGKARAGRRDLFQGIKVCESDVVNRPASECYAVWRRLENLPRFMPHLKAVRVVDDRRSQWVAEAPLGGSVVWDAEIIEDRPNELISWRSVGDADVANAGSVRFRPSPGGRGTEVQVELNYEPPAGRIGAGIASLLGSNPAQQLREDLHQFKLAMEAGGFDPNTGLAVRGRRGR